MKAGNSEGPKEHGAELSEKLWTSQNGLQLVGVTTAVATDDKHFNKLLPLAKTLHN